jgi:hypothetical protein
MYSIEVWTGSQQQQWLFRAIWSIYKAMLNWRDKVRDSVTWNSKSCVLDVDAEGIENTDTQEGGKERDRGTAQWISVMSVRIGLYFDSADLLSNN